MSEIISPPRFIEPLEMPSAQSPYAKGGKDFNPDWLPAPYNELVKRETLSLEVNTSAVAAAFLGAVSIAVNGRFRVTERTRDAGGDVERLYSEPAQLWLMVVLESAERKSDCIGAFTSTIDKWVDKQNRSRERKRKPLEAELAIIDGKIRGEIKEQQGSESQDVNEQGVSVVHFDRSKLDSFEERREEIIAQLGELHDIDLILQDSTPEAVAVAMSHNNGRVSLANDEGGIFGTMQGRYSQKPNIEIFLKAYNNSRFTVKRIGRANILIPCASMAMLYFVQPDVLNEVLSCGTMALRGFVGRFMLIRPPISSGIRP